MENEIKLNEDYVAKLAGVANDVLAKVTKFESPLGVFFTPYSTPKAAFFSAATIVTAPVMYGSLAIKYSGHALSFTLEAIARLVEGDFAKAGEALTNAFAVLIVAGLTGVSALLSPVINFVDFIGSLVKTAVNAFSNAQNAAPAPSMV